MNKDSIELSALAKYFEFYNRTEGKSPKTVEWYNQALRQFHHFLIKNGKSSRLGELSQAETTQGTNQSD